MRINSPPPNFIWRLMYLKTNYLPYHKHRTPNETKQKKTKEKKPQSLTRTFHLWNGNLRNTQEISVLLGKATRWNPQSLFLLRSKWNHEAGRVKSLSPFPDTCQERKHRYEEFLSEDKSITCSQDYRVWHVEPFHWVGHLMPDLDFPERSSGVNKSSSGISQRGYLKF